MEELRGRNNTIVTRWIKGTDHYIHIADELDPIPLTEEILLKCGFKKQKLVVSGCIYSIKIKDLWYSVYFKGSTYIFDNMHHPVEVKSLHQLQNLIFLLTEGKELDYE